MSSLIRYNKKSDAVYINVLPRVEEGFTIDTAQLISDAYVITLVKDDKLNEWRVFAFGGRSVDPFVRNDRTSVLRHNTAFEVRK